MPGRNGFVVIAPRVLDLLGNKMGLGVYIYRSVGLELSDDKVIVLCFSFWCNNLG